MMPPGCLPAGWGGGWVGGAWGFKRGPIGAD
jgi:hypothetical protein